MLRENLVTQGVTVGKYRIEARVAEGGMGVFWRAHDTKLDRTVGLKTLHTEFAIEPQLRERFVNEARALAKLNHPNICVLHDFFDSGEQLYIVMEYIVGETLADIVRHTGALKRSQIIPIFRQILLALDYAHSHGVIHRDIKPSNIMVSEQGMVKVMDFGIAKMVEAPTQLTRTGRKVGSILYMSPEQIREQPVDHRSDLYSLGVALYQVCTGKVPFDATSEYEAMKAHLEDMPPPPRSLNPEVAEDLEYVITRAMSKRPEDRFQSAEEMRAALGAADLTATSDRVTIASGQKTRVGLGSDTGEFKAKKRGFKKVFLVSALVVASLLALRVGFRMRHLGIPVDLASTATPKGDGAPAPLVTTPSISSERAGSVPDSLAQAASTINTEAPGMTNPATDPTSPDGNVTPTEHAEESSAAANPGSSVGVMLTRTNADSPPTTSAANLKDAPVGGAGSPTAPHKSRPAQDQAAVPAVKEEGKPQVLNPPAKPVVRNKYTLSVVVQPGGLFQVDRTGWGQKAGKLDEGAHRLEAMAPGFPIFSEKFRLRSDTTITIDLEARFAGHSNGDLRISAKSETGEFPPCQVKVNGAAAGLLPGLRLPLKSGAYEIELVPPENLRVDSLQFEGTSFPGARARINVPPTSRSFARYFLSARK